MKLWILLIVISAFFNAAWTSLTKNKDKNLSALQFTTLFRLYTIIFLFPFFLMKFDNKFWGGEFLFYAFLYALVEGVRTIFIVKGAEKDYYSTFAFVNISPIFTLLFAPVALNEKINMILIFGTVVIITGAFLFYKIGKFSWWGLSVAFISGMGSLVAKKGVSVSDGISFSIIAFLILVVNFFLIDLLINKKDIIFKLIKKSKTIFLPAFFSSLGTAAYFTALETGPISKIAPIQRLNLFFGFFMSYFLLREHESWKTKFVGGMLILIGGVMVYMA